MNVLMLTPMVPSDVATSAGAIVMRDEVRAVATRHRVTLAALAMPDDEAAIRSLEDDGIRVHAVRRSVVQGVRGGVRRAQLGVRWRLGELPLRTLVFLESSMQRVLDRLPGSPFDVVHVLDNAMAAYRRPDGRRALLTEYETRVEPEDGVIDTPDDESTAPREAEHSRWLRYQSAIWTQFDHVQVFTERDAEVVRRLAPAVTDRICVNPFGVDVPAAVPTDGDDGRFSGRQFAADHGGLRRT